MQPINRNEIESKESPFDLMNMSSAAARSSNGQCTWAFTETLSVCRACMRRWENLVLVPTVRDMRG